MAKAKRAKKATTNDVLHSVGQVLLGMEQVSEQVDQIDNRVLELVRAHQSTANNTQRTHAVLNHLHSEMQTQDKRHASDLHAIMDTLMELRGQPSSDSRPAKAVDRNGNAIYEQPSNNYNVTLTSQELNQINSRLYQHDQGFKAYEQHLEDERNARRQLKDCVIELKKQTGDALRELQSISTVNDQRVLALTERVYKLEIKAKRKARAKAVK